MAICNTRTDIPRLISIQKLIEQCRFLANQGRLLTQRPGSKTIAPGISVEDFFGLTASLKKELLYRYYHNSKVADEVQKLPGDLVEKKKQKKSNKWLEGFCDASGEIAAGLLEIFPVLLILLIPVFIWLAAKEANPVYQLEILRAVEQFDKLERLIEK